MFLLPDVSSILAYDLGLVVDSHCGSAGACYWRSASLSNSLLMVSSNQMSVRSLNGPPSFVDSSP
jgi:hypothetical protein